MALVVRDAALDSDGKWGAPIVHGEYAYYFPTPGGTNSNGAPLPNPTPRFLKFHAPSLTWSHIDVSDLVPAEYPKIRFGSAIKVTRQSGSFVYVMPDRWPYVLRLDLNDDSVSRIPINVDGPNGSFAGGAITVPYGFPQESVNGRIIAGCRGTPSSDLFYSGYGYDWNSSRMLVVDTTTNKAWTIQGPSSNRFCGSTYHIFPAAPPAPPVEKMYFMSIDQGSGYNSIAVNPATLAVTRVTIPARPGQTNNPKYLHIPAVGTDGKVYGKVSSWVYRLDPTASDATAVEWVATNDTLASMFPRYENSVVATEDGKILFFPSDTTSNVATQRVHAYDIASNTVTQVDVAYGYLHNVTGVVEAAGRLWSINTQIADRRGAAFLPNVGPITFYPKDPTSTFGGGSLAPAPPQNVGGRIFIINFSSGVYPSLVRYIDVGPPIVTGLSPSSGPEAGGTSVTITGTSLDGATSVTFGGVPATFTIISDTQIIVTSPPGTGSVHVVVTTPFGVSPATAADLFTYVPAPARLSRHHIGLVVSGSRG